MKLIINYLLNYKIADQNHHGGDRQSCHLIVQIGVLNGNAAPVFKDMLDREIISFIYLFSFYLFLFFFVLSRFFRGEDWKQSLLFEQSHTILTFSFYY